MRSRGKCSLITGRLRINPRSSHTKDPKILFDTVLLNTHHYKVRIKGKWSDQRKEVASTSTPRYRNYSKGSLRVSFNYGRQLYFGVELSGEGIVGRR